MLEGAGPATNHAEFEPALAHALALVSQTEALQAALFSGPEDAPASTPRDGEPS